MRMYMDEHIHNQRRNGQNMLHAPVEEVALNPKLGMLHAPVEEVALNPKLDMLHAPVEEVSIACTSLLNPKS
jgi:hypothetical protein